MNVEQRAIFLDRDGTIITDKHYLHDPSEIELIEGVVEALLLLQRMNYLLIVVTNQSGVGRGYFELADVEACNLALAEILLKGGVHIHGWYVCPHSPDSGCNCRKPLPGLVDQARMAFSICNRASFVVGDKASDLLLANNCGMSGILVKTGCGEKYEYWAKNNKYGCFSDLNAFARYLADYSVVE